MKKNILLVTILLQSVYLCAQKFHSTIEKEVFIEYKKNSTYQFIKSICAIDSTFTNDNLTDYLGQIKNLIAQIPPKELKEKKEKKRVKLIYDIFHKKFLKKYELESYFNDIFKTGNYNCVTASALYAYVFDALKIPYHVKEAPSHVYLIAYPNTYQIYLETTAPGAYGFSAPKDTEIKKIVDELIKVKLISENELTTKGYNNTYNDYFYGKEFIKTKSLIGMQYYNKAIFNLQKENFSSAENNLSKSLVFFNSPLAKIVYKDLIKMNINSLEFDKTEDVELLIRYFSQLEYKKDFNKADIEYYLHKIILNDANNIAFIKEAAENFNTIENDALKNTSKEILYNYIAKIEADEFNFKESLQYSDSILKINKNSKIAKQIIPFVLQKKTAIKGATPEALNELEKYYNKYSFLENDKRIETLRALIYGESAVKSILSKNIEEAIKHLASFENILENKKKYLILRSEFYPFVYLKVGRYYYGKSKFKKAKDIFERGLKYAPEDASLVKMLKWAKEDMN